MPVLLGVEDTLQSGQLAVLLCDGRDDSIREQHYVRTLLARRVDGIIVTGRQERPAAAARPLDLPVPVIYAMSESADPNDASILPDDEGGGGLAVEYLLATGRTRSATSPALKLPGGPAAGGGAERALADAGLAISGGRPFHGEWSEAWGRQAASISCAGARNSTPFSAAATRWLGGWRGASGNGQKGPRRYCPGGVRQLDGHGRGLTATAHHG